MSLESSIELIQRAQTGDEQALDRLIARYRPRLRRWAAGRLPRFAREMVDTEDLVQEALVGTIQNFRDFELRGEWALQGYLRQAVTNRIRDELRRHSRRPARDDLDDLPGNECSPLEATIGRQQFDRYQQALEALEPIEREAVIARLELSLSYSDIAALINKSSPDAARMTVARALAKLARHMA
jgi:RNA polymerase sigma-70 factor (ECF subfamily)